MSELKAALPRVIRGNRGDLASRWALIRNLHSLEVKPISVFCQNPEDVPQVGYAVYPYGKVRNLLQSGSGRKALHQADTILWAVGLDLQDDSSLTKLLYLRLLFASYRFQGKKIWCAFQGAGPIQTRLGKWLAADVLGQVDIFVARDPATYRLVKSLAPSLDVRLGQDAIFLPGLEQDLLEATHLPGDLEAIFSNVAPVIGLNLRQWFHFSSGLLPYEIARKGYKRRSEGKMAVLLDRTSYLISHIRKIYPDAHILLLSAYQANQVPWEDDSSWLAQVQAQFSADDHIHLADQPLSIPQYFQVISRLNLMVAMRLHSCLISLRFGVPAINISYTLKGQDIFQYLGLHENVRDLEQLMEDPDAITDTIDLLMGDLQMQCKKSRDATRAAIAQNVTVLNSLLQP